MAHSKQAKKRIRQNESAAARNRPVRTYTMRRVRDARDAVDDRAPDAQDAVRAAQAALDRAASAGVIHRNTAARRKSRLAKALKTAAAAT
jgi:small subunit ribosomal protein S20